MLRQAEVELAQGKRIGEVCRMLGIFEQSYYRWRSEYGETRASRPHGRAETALHGGCRLGWR